MGNWKLLLTAVFLCVQCTTAARGYRKPQLICPSQVEGRKSPGIQCGIPNLPNVSTVEIRQSGKPVITCNEKRMCKGSGSYEPVDKVFSQHDFFWISINIKSVSARDEGKWTCSYKMKNNQEVLEEECHLEVLEVSDSKPCDWNVNEEDEIEVTCTADWMYSSGMCVWDTAVNGTFMMEEYRGSANVNKTKAVCVMTIPSQPEIGNHTVYGRLSNSSKWPYPAVTAFPQKDIFIEPPSNPPVISVAIDQSHPQHVKTIAAEVGQDVLINCSVAGGTPPVHRTILTCQSQTADTSGRSERAQNGQSVAMTIHVTDQINGTICTCTAQHVTQQYFKRASVVFSENLFVPPECPHDLLVSALYSNAVTLQWTPIFDGGLRQTFTILQQDITNLTSSSNDDFISVGHVTDSGEKTMTYTIIGLSSNRYYVFSLKVENSFGIKQCTPLQVYAHINKEESIHSWKPTDEIDRGLTEGGLSLTFIITVVPLAGLLFISAVIVSCLCWKRRHHQRPSVKNPSVTFQRVGLGQYRTENTSLRPVSEHTSEHYYSEVLDDDLYERISNLSESNECIQAMSRKTANVASRTTPRTAAHVHLSTAGYITPTFVDYEPFQEQGRKMVEKVQV